MEAIKANTKNIKGLEGAEAPVETRELQQLVNGTRHHLDTAPNNPQQETICTTTQRDTNDQPPFNNFQGWTQTYNHLQGWMQTTMHTTQRADQLN